MKPGRAPDLPRHRLDNTENQDFNTFTVGLNATFGY
ncbi:hypothetical protein BDD21_4543 [Thiocapsa rosea]|uniref:Uncharacterized protein n=1 Tax=Thiocapsa rosea TaxID=69360 RepID=A0A495VF18_9GAMM|nr:hypothetical protein BDD21_4543 [Thiocapsa rosea]